MEESANTLREENEALRARLSEVEETLHAIGRGQVDAVMVEDQLYLLSSAAAVSSQLRGEALAQVGDAVVMTDKESRVIWLNAAAERYYGVTGNDVLGKHVDHIYECSWPRPVDETAMFQALQQQGHWRGELVHQTARGDSLPVESSVTVVNHQTVGFITVTRDVSERREAEAALREADRRKDQFLAVLAHELRNPLAPLRTALDLLRMDGDTESTALRCRDVIDRQVTQLTRLIGDLVDVARFSQGSLILQRSRIMLDSVLDAAIEATLPLIEGRRQRLVLRRPEHPIALDVDQARLTQVFGNLINNAAKYSPEGSEIEIVSRVEGGRVAISIRDQGQGIAEDMMDRVFDLFFRTPRAGSHTGDGLGIGLWLARRLVEMHGGTLTLASKGSGQGAEFTVRLPAVSDRTPADNIVVARGNPEVNRRVLVVDDNVDAALVLVLLLSRLGCEAHAVHSGQAALEAAERLDPQVVLLDIGLPDMSGIEVGRRLRARAGSEDLMLVAITGWGTEADRQLSARAGFDRHLVKPVEHERLLEVLQAAPV